MKLIDRKTITKKDIYKAIALCVDLPSIQRMIKQNFGIYSFKPETLESNLFKKKYYSWDEKKQQSFCKLIGGHVYSKKIHQIIQGEDEFSYLVKVLGEEKNDRD